MILVLALQGGEGFLSLFEDVVLPADQLAPEILPLPFIHEGLVFCRTITLINHDICHVQPFFPDDQVTDEPDDVRVAELIREAALEGVRDELPHSLAVVVDEIVPREERTEDNPLTDVRATMYVERSSQKAIIIGRQGARLREVGQTARRDIESLLGVPVFLARNAWDLRTTTEEWPALRFTATREQH